MSWLIPFLVKNEVRLGSRQTSFSRRLVTYSEGNSKKKELQNILSSDNTIVEKNLAILGYTYLEIPVQKSTS